MPRIRSLLVLFLVVSLAPAADWPQWLGPTRDGASPEKVAPWKEAPKVLWRQPVGEGNSSPVVAGGRVYIHSKVKGKDEEEVLALDAGSGKEVWRKTYARAAFKSAYGNGPRATPTVADGKLYTYGITGVLTCWDAAKGDRLWQVDVLKKFGAANIRFGASCSPLVEGKSVVINVGGKGASVVAFARDSGEVVWKSGDDGASYSSPIAVGKGKGRQVIVLTRAAAVGLDPADGTRFWSYPFKDALFESSCTPAVSGDLLLLSAISRGSAGLRLTTADGKPTASEVWKQPELTSYFSTPVAVGPDHFYMIAARLNLFNMSGSEADLRCVETKGGKSAWTKKKVGQFHAALLRTGDDKLLMLEDGGDLVLIDPSPKEYTELARAAKVCGPTWAHPALAGGKLYLRDEKEVVCLRLGE